MRANGGTKRGLLLGILKLFWYNQPTFRNALYFLTHSSHKYKYQKLKQSSMKQDVSYIIMYSDT